MQKTTIDIPTEPRFALAKKTADQFLIDHHITSLPFHPEQALKEIGCRVVTYAELACLNGTTLEDVATAIGSNDGYTVLWKQKRYIVFINDAINSDARIRWTLTHELSHILLHHLEEYTSRQTWLATNDEMHVLDREANACTSELLSPASVLYTMGCCKSKMIHEVCGISYEAAKIRQNLFDNVDVYMPNHTEARLLPQFIGYMNRTSIA